MRARGPRRPAQSFDVYLDYACPRRRDLPGRLAGHRALGRDLRRRRPARRRRHVRLWPPLATAEMDDYYRRADEPARPGGVARKLVSWSGRHRHRAGGVGRPLRDLGQRGRHRDDGHAAAASPVEHDLWPAMADPAQARPAVQEALRLGTPFPQASRFAREPFTVGDVAVQPGDQVLMWLTAANRDVPGPHRQPLDRFDPERDNGRPPGVGLGLPPAAGACTTPARSPSRRSPPWPSAARS